MNRKNGKIYGYCRVSTKGQHLERQMRNILAKYPDAVIITEKYTGTSMNRPEWKRYYKSFTEGDLIVFDSVSRMSRDAEEGYAIYEELFQRGVELEFLNEPHVNTETYKSVQQIELTGTDADLILEGVNQYLLRLAKRQIQLAFEQSEKEVTDLHKRTREGMESARRNGKQIGQKQGAKLTTKKSVQAKEIIRKHAKAFGGSLSDEETRKLTGVSRNTYYKYKSELREE